MGRSPRPQGKGKPGHSASQTCLPGIWTSQGAASRRGAPPSEVGTQKTGLSPIRVIGSTLLPQKPRLRISPSKKITLRIQPPVPPPSDPGAQEPRPPAPPPSAPGDWAHIPFCFRPRSHSTKLLPSQTSRVGDSSPSSLKISRLAPQPLLSHTQGSSSSVLAGSRVGGVESGGGPFQLKGSRILYQARRAEVLGALPLGPNQ